MGSVEEAFRSLGPKGVNMAVELRPRHPQRRSKYRQVEVIGCYPGMIGLPISGRFNTTIKLEGVQGHKGVAVLGARYFQKKKF